MTNYDTPTHEKTITADGTLVVTLTNVASPGGGLDEFRLPTQYEVHQPADGETIAGQPIAGWLHTNSKLYGHQSLAIYRDLERLKLGVMEWDESTLSRRQVPPTFRRADGVTMEALVARTK